MATTATTVRSAGRSRRSAVLGSDLLDRRRAAEVAQPPGAPDLVMATYAAGQSLLVPGWAARHTPRARPGHSSSCARSAA